MFTVLKGYRTVISMGLALVVGLYQMYVEPLPAIDPKLWNIAVPTVAIILRFMTDGPLPLKDRLKFVFQFLFKA